MGWDKVKENEFLNKEFDCKNRSRITTYKLLNEFLSKLKSIKSEKVYPQHNDVNYRAEILNQIDQILEKLHWDENHGRNFLYKKLNVTSRQNLNNEKLAEFALLLKDQLKDEETTQDEQ